MTIDLTRAQARALAILATEYLKEGGANPKINPDDLSAALLELGKAWLTTSVNISRLK
jgi:hypothetical protein